MRWALKQRAQKEQGDVNHLEPHAVQEEKMTLDTTEKDDNEMDEHKVSLKDETLYTCCTPWSPTLDMLCS